MSTSVKITVAIVDNETGEQVAYQCTAPELIASLSATLDINDMEFVRQAVVKALATLAVIHNQREGGWS